jgi:hypothetical protein
MNQCLDFYSIQLVGHAIAGDLDVKLLNSVASIFLKWRTFTFLKWMRNVNQSTWDLDILCADRCTKDDHKYGRGGRLKVKIHILFHGER